MAIPTVTKIWAISPCNRIAYVSLIATMQAYLHGVKTFLKAHGYTVKGSASAGVGAMDGVDRWTATTDVTPRATVDAASQAWIVLVDATGAELLLDYQGASDDIARISMSSDGTGFAAAGTPSQRPTNANELILSSASSLIGNGTSGDRLWSGWVDSTSKLCRFAIARSGSWLHLWGVELINSTVTGALMVYTRPVWGFAMAGSATAVATGGVGKAYSLVSSAAKLATMSHGVEMFAALVSTFGAVKPPSQGGLGYPAFPLSVGSGTAGAEGKYGNLFDTWIGRTSGGADGDVATDLTLIGMAGYNGNNGAGLWPWDGVTTPIMT